MWVSRHSAAPSYYTAASCTHLLLSFASFCLFLTIFFLFFLFFDSGTASASNDGVLGLDCDSRRAVGPVRTILWVFMTQLNRVERLAVLSASNERSFYVPDFFSSSGFR